MLLPPRIIESPIRPIAEWACGVVNSGHGRHVLVTVDNYPACRRKTACYGEMATSCRKVIVAHDSAPNLYSCSSLLPHRSVSRARPLPHCFPLPLGPFFQSSQTICRGGELRILATWVSLVVVRLWGAVPIPGTVLRTASPPTRPTRFVHARFSGALAHKHGHRCRQ